MSPSLGPGTRVGAFEILSLLGSGGMGEVYRARDTVLKREVALKVLPEAFARDAERVARFTREAEVLASLNHPHIAQIYGVAEGEGVHAIVMEFVDGEDLARRLARGAIPLGEALPLARQIAEALEAAHDHGVIHRDLKPANVTVRGDGTVKVLDFGLAKALQDPTTPGSQDPSASPTITSPAMTMRGVILGTAAYMSPEQARGKPVDRRADIWAFGCVLFEMLTGTPAFTGETVTDVLAAVIDKEPGWIALPAATPAAIRRLLQRCLAKDLALRLPHIGAARLELDDALAERAPDTARRETGDPTSTWPVSARVAVAALALAGAGTIGWLARPAPVPTPRPVIRFEIDLPVDVVATENSGTDRPLAASPDGSRIVYMLGNRLHVRAVDGVSATPLAGTEGVSTRFNPFFSPDGQWVAFYRGGHLLKVALAGGTPTIVCAVDVWGGGSWGADERIVYAQLDGIYRVPAAGGVPERLIALDPGKGEEARNPQVLPGSTTVLYSFNQFPASWNDGQIVAQVPGAPERRVVVEGAMAARYVRTGHLVFARNAALYAVPFDVTRLATTGDPVQVADGVDTSPAGTSRANIFRGQRQFGSGSVTFAVSDHTLLYGPPSPGSSLVWVDRQGDVRPVGEPLGSGYHTVRLAADGQRVVADGGAASGGGAWVVDLARDARTLLLRPPTAASNPVWTSDGRRVTFRLPERNGASIYEKDADGTGDERAVFSAPGQFDEPSWAADGSALLITAESAARLADVLVVTRGGTPRPVVASTADERAARFSPDGRWIAYQSDASGRPEIYVQPYPAPGPRVLVSTRGGTAPVWARDGSELFYHEGTALMAVPVRTAPTFSVGAPGRLFDVPVAVDGTGHAAYDVAPDGRRFLMILPRPANRITVVLNFDEELKARVAAR